LKEKNPIWNFTPLLLLLIIVLAADWEELVFFSSAAGAGTGAVEAKSWGSL
jgi:hypothetical protein